MSARRRATAFFAVLLVLCLAGQALTVRRVDSLRPEKTLEEVLYIPSAAVLKRLCLGYDGLLADIYWTRAVQYFGARLRAPKTSRYDLLYPLLDITTSLDPHLIPAYEFGAIFLTQPPPVGSGEPQKAVQLLEKGIAANPDKWRLYWNLGFIHYLELRDYDAAAKAFYTAGSMPNGNPNVLPLAAMAEKYGGRLETSRRIWLQVYEDAKQDMIKQNAERHILSIDSDLIVGRIEEIIALYRERQGADPQTWGDLVRAGMLRGVPLDPAGNPYRLLPGGQVVVKDKEKLPFITKGLPPA